MSNEIKIEVDESTKGKIFDIKRFATKDGPGIRTLVFLKGCPLICKWCANPESQEYKTHVMYYRNKCVYCGKCIARCPQQAIKLDEDFGLKVSLDKCLGCGECVEACYYSALEVIGEDISVGELIQKVMRDKEFYDNSGGGITVSGGEPLFQPVFTRELLKACKKNFLKTAIETCGYTKWPNIDSILPYTDLIYYDIKHIDPVLHKKYTGVSNKLIIDNLKMLNQVFNNIIVRVPFVPGYNDEDSVQKKIYNFLSDLNNIKRVEIMPYHRLGKSKYEGLGRDYRLKDLQAVNKKEIDYLKIFGLECGIEVNIE